ncbi:uncharacterized protein PRD47_001618 isoform 1-T1 [Ara ararauna]
MPGLNMAVPRPSLLFILKEDWTRALRFGFRRGNALDTRKTQRVKPTSLKSLLPPATRAMSVAVNYPPGHWNDLNKQWNWKGKVKKIVIFSVTAVILTKIAIVLVPPLEHLLAASTTDDEAQMKQFASS